MRTIRASEIGAYLFCQRAWWYSKSGLPSQNQAEMTSGSELHLRHGRAVLSIGCLRLLAYAMILLALAALAVYFTNRLL